METCIVPFSPAVKSVSECAGRAAPSPEMTNSEWRLGTEVKFRRTTTMAEEGQAQGSVTAAWATEPQLLSSPSPNLTSSLAPDEDGPSQQHSDTDADKERTTVAPCPPLTKNHTGVCFLFS